MVRLPLGPEEKARGERLGALLREARGNRSMLDVAIAAGISPETLRKIETGRVATPAFSTVALVACELGLSLDAVWGDVGRGSRRAGAAAGTGAGAGAALQR